MPSRFSRSFKLFQLLFPGAFEAGQPQTVENTVLPVWDALAMRLGECRIITETTGNQNVVAAFFSFTSSEPPAGYVHIPILMSVYHESAAAEQWNITIQATATTPLDQWGRMSANIVAIESIFSGIGPVIYQPLHLPPIITRGNTLQMDSTTTLTSPVTKIDYMYVLAPGELVVFQALGRGL